MGEVCFVLNNFILIDHRQVRHICKTIADYHNRHRPHQGIGNVVPGGYDYPDFDNRFLLRFFRIFQRACSDFVIDCLFLGLFCALLFLISFCPGPRDVYIQSYPH